MEGNCHEMIGVQVPLVVKNAFVFDEGRDRKCWTR